MRENSIQTCKSARHELHNIWRCKKSAVIHCHETKDLLFIKFTCYKITGNCLTVIIRLATHLAVVKRLLVIKHQ